MRFTFLWRTHSGNSFWPSDLIPVEGIDLIWLAVVARESHLYFDLDPTSGCRLTGNSTDTDDTPIYAQINKPKKPWVIIQWINTLNTPFHTSLPISPSPPAFFVSIPRDNPTNFVGVRKSWTCATWPRISQTLPELRRMSPNHVSISIRIADASLLWSLRASRSAMETNTAGWWLSTSNNDWHLA